MLVTESNAPVRIAVRTGLTSYSRPADMDLRNVSDRASRVRKNAGSTLFLIVNMVVAVVVAMFVIAVVVSVRMPMAVAAENKEPEQVRGQTGRANDEHELGVVDLGGVDKSSQGFENDGDAKSD